VLRTAWSSTATRRRQSNSARPDERRRPTARRLGGGPVEFVPEFCYLGVLFHAKGGFGRYVADRVRKAMVAMPFIRQPQRLSLKTGAALFNIRVASVASYGIQVAWEELTAAQLGALDRVKPAFFKRALGLSRHARNTPVYPMARELPFIEDLVKRFQPPLRPRSKPSGRAAPRKSVRSRSNSTRPLRCAPADGRTRFRTSGTSPQDTPAMDSTTRCASRAAITRRREGAFVGTAGVPARLITGLAALPRSRSPR